MTWKLRSPVVIVTFASFVIGFAGQNYGDEQTAGAESRVLVATVLGKQIYLDQITPADNAAKRKELSKADYEKWFTDYRVFRLFQTVSAQVLAEYASREKLRPTREELSAMLSEAVKKHPELFKDEQTKKSTAIRLFWLQGASRDWITAKALHEKYGGRIAISSFGACVSIDGRNAILREYAKAGAIKFHHAEMERRFWDRTKDKRVLDVTIQDPKRIAKRFAVAPWERWMRGLDSKNVESDQPEAGQPEQQPPEHDSR